MNQFIESAMERTIQGTPITEYQAIHHWLKINYGRASKCESKECVGKSQNYQWAKKTGKVYARRRSHFLQLCRSCHSKYDFTEEMRRKISKALTGRTHSEARNRAFSLSRTGVKHTKLARANMSVVQRLNREKSKRSKLTLAKAQKIRELFKMGMTQTKVAKMFGVTQPTINVLLKGYTWQPVKTL